MNKITHDIVDILKNKLIENDYQEFLISLSDILDDFNFPKRKDLRNDLGYEIRSNLLLDLIDIRKCSDSGLCRIYSIVDDITEEIMNYLCAITLEQIDNKIINTIQKYTNRKVSDIGSMIHNLQTAYDNKYFVYSLNKEFKIVMYWDNVLVENEDLKKTLIYPIICSLRV